MEKETTADDLSFITSVEPLKTKTGRPSTFRKNYISVEGIVDEEPAVQAEMTNTESKVIATTHKKKKPIKKVWSRIKEVIGMNKKNKIYKDIDFDLKLFNGTCLEGNTLSVPDISVINSKLEGLSRYLSRSQKIRFIQSSAENLCRIKERIFAKDINFDRKYRNLYIYLIGLGFTSGSFDEISPTFNRIINMNDNELKRMDLSFGLSNMNPSLSDFEINVNRRLYDASEDDENITQLLSRPKGGTKRKKYRKHRTRKY
jgi:hypothetical protein